MMIIMIALMLLPMVIYHYMKKTKENQPTFPKNHLIFLAGEQ